MGDASTILSLADSQLDKLTVENIHNFATSFARRPEETPKRASERAARARERGQLAASIWPNDLNKIVHGSSFVPPTVQRNERPFPLSLALECGPTCEGEFDPTS